MEQPALLEALARDGRTFADAAESAGPATPIASCPGWSMSDLVWHLGVVHDFWRQIVSEQRDSWEGVQPPDRPADDALAAWYRTNLDATIAALRAADPAQPNWTWSSDHTAGFVIRRMAQETAVHCWDAEAAAGTVRPIDAELAGDGIDEFLYHFLDHVSDRPAVGGTVHLHCTDVAGEWLVRHGTAGFDVVREHAKGDAAMRGPANDLLLVLWRRAPIGTIDIRGDAEVAARFVAHTNLD